jgi:hypothetical protein
MNLKIKLTEYPVIVWNFCKWAHTTHVFFGSDADVLLLLLVPPVCVCWLQDKYFLGAIGVNVGAQRLCTSAHNQNDPKLTFFIVIPHSIEKLKGSNIISVCNLSSHFNVSITDLCLQHTKFVIHLQIQISSPNI